MSSPQYPLSLVQRILRNRCSIETFWLVYGTETFRCSKEKLPTQELFVVELLVVSLPKEIRIPPIQKKRMAIRMIEEYNIEKSSKSEEKVVRHWQSKPSPWRLHYKKNERKIPARTNCRQQEVVTRASNRGTVGGAPISSRNSQLRMTERRNLTSLAFSKDQSWDFSPSFFMNMDSQLVRRTDRRGF